VHDLGKDWIKVAIDNDIVSVERDTCEDKEYTWDIEKNELATKVAGTFMQYPLRLAWALTINKSQGLSMDRIYLDFTNDPFAPGQTYVVLSRGRTLDGLKLSRQLWPNDIFTDKKVREFYDRL
jgi:ATP-dependent exoDNAse (exonuclease V) alpha subunit